MSFFILVIFLLLSCMNSIYFRYKSNSSVNNYENNDVIRINEDFIINIISKNNDIYEGYILLINYSIKNHNYIEINKNSYNELSEKNDFDGILKLINFDEIKEPNLKLYKTENDKIHNEANNKIYKFYGYYLLSVKFNIFNLVEIYKPEEFIDKDFYYLIQDINKAYFINKDNLNSYFNLDDDFQCVNNNAIPDFLKDIFLQRLYDKFGFENEKIDDSNDNKDENNDFSFKEHFFKKIKDNKFNIDLFKRNILGFSLYGKAFINIIDSNNSLVKIKIYLKIKYFKIFEIFSKDIKVPTDKLKDFLEYFGDKCDWFKDKIFDYFIKNKDGKIKKVADNVLEFIFSIDYRKLFNNPKTYIFEFIKDNCNLNIILDVFSKYFKLFTDFTIENYSNLKNLLNLMFDRIYNVLSEYNYFFDMDSLKNVFSSTFVLIKDSTKNIYDTISNSKYVSYSKDFIKQSYDTISNSKYVSYSADYIKQGYDKIKNVATKENVYNLYEKVGNVVNKENIMNLGEKIKSNTINLKDKMKNIKEGAESVKDTIGNYIKKGYEKISKPSDKEDNNNLFGKIGNAFNFNIGSKFSSIYNKITNKNNDKKKE